MNRTVLSEPVYDTDAVNKRYVDKTLSLIYPVGSIYMNVSPVNPNEIFSFGVWERIEDMFLLSAGSIFEGGTTGGEAEHTLTIEEMPNHQHNLWKLPLVDSYGGGANASGYTLPSLSSKTANKIISEATGGEQPHNNMPPYLAVYTWKRIA